MKEKMLKPTILSVSLLTIMASAAVAPALGKIRLAFPHASDTLIKLVLTLPPLIIIPFSLLSGWLVLRFKKKTLMITGLLIYLLAGCGGGFARNINELLFIRAILGIGVGLIMPLSTTLVGDFFEGGARSKMMGLATSVQNLGGVVFQIAAGYLAVISWRYSFGVYSLALLILILIIAFLPEPPKLQPKPGQKTKSKLPLGVYLCALLCILNMVVFYAILTNLAILLETEKKMFTSQTALFTDKEDLQQHLKAGTISDITRKAFKENNINLSDKASVKPGDSTTSWQIIDSNKKYIIRKENNTLVINAEKLGKAAIAGYILSVLSLSAMFSGIFLNQIMGLLKRFMLAWAILLMALGYWFLGHAINITMIVTGVLMAGFGFGIIQPSLFVFVQKIAPQDGRALAMAVIGSSIFLGQFLSPVVLGIVSSLSGQNSIYFKFNVCAAIVGVGALIAFIFSLSPRKKTQAI